MTQPLSTSNWGTLANGAGVANHRIIDALDSTYLDVTALVDRPQIEAYRQNIAKQMNRARAPQNFFDLSDRIADVIIQTSAQGASILEVHIIDPDWMLLKRNTKANNVAFIDAYDDGYLLPIEIAFPPNTDCRWALCAVNVTLDYTQPNIVLTFEDKIANDLRHSQRAMMSIAGESLAHFIGRAVNTANKAIKVVQLVNPQDPNYQHPDPPSSARQPVSPARGDPNKVGQTVRQVVNEITQSVESTLNSLTNWMGVPPVQATSTTTSGELGLPNPPAPGPNAPVWN